VKLIQNFGKKSAPFFFLSQKQVTKNFNPLIYITVPVSIGLSTSYAFE
jgi:hypothetical protein